MSAIHIRQIRAFLHTTYDGLIDLNDYADRADEDRESAFLSRALAAFAIQSLADTEAASAAGSVTDGFGDNGIDAIHYDAKEKILYLVQSKWDHDGSGSLARGDTQKFLKGCRDLIAPQFSRFNVRIQSMAPTVNTAISDAKTRIFLVVTYSGQQPLSAEVKADFDDVLRELNDPTDVVTLKTLRQLNIYNTISHGATGAAIDLDVVLHEWGQTREPVQAFYGQVSATDVASWWDTHYPQLFSPNIRMFLGDTDVNLSLLTTLRSAPENFWYFNNGITALCATITKKAIGGSSRDMGVFECRDLRIVNGAQTVGSIAAAAASHPEDVAKARVPIRLVSLESCPEGFDREITRTNNTQNRIERRDFVALDPEQERLKNELHLEGITYVYKSGESVPTGAQGFDLDDGTVARACAQPDIGLTMQAKREIGRLWEDIQKPPYKLLFNGGVSGLNLWKHVQILREVDSALTHQQSTLEGRGRMFAIHGNRVVAHLVFRDHPVGPDTDYAPLTTEEQTSIRNEVAGLLTQMQTHADSLYPDSYIASLFKNQSKCKGLVEAITQDQQTVAGAAPDGNPAMPPSSPVTAEEPPSVS
jgi:hypothetical protein